MHLVTSKARLVALLVALAAVAAAFLATGSLSPREHASADTTFDLTGVACIDMYIDGTGAHAPVKGDVPPASADLVGKGMIRIEPDGGGGWDATPLVYLGPGDFIPEKPPSSLDCAGKGDDNDLTWNDEVKFDFQNSNSRPTGVGVAQTGPESGPGCSNLLDDDGDTFINEGCTAGVPATAAESVCTGNADDDGDTFVNDGCPQVGGTAESGTQCNNATDNDSDSSVNDGCPAVTNEERGVHCMDSVDSDGDTVANDGCAGLKSLTFKICSFQENLLGGRNVATHWNIALTGAPSDGTTYYGVLMADILQNSTCSAPASSQIQSTILRITYRDAGGVGDTDWDGDGCSDWDELGDPPAGAGRDPFNPNDCIANPGGVYNILTTVTSASKPGLPESKVNGDCVSNLDDDADTFVNDGCPAMGAVEAGGNCSNNMDDDGDTLVNDGCIEILTDILVAPGTYFYCIARLDKSGGGPLFDIDGYAFCYQDSPSLSGLSNTPPPSDADGRAGPPPPPPYSAQLPYILSGQWDSGTNILDVNLCAADLSGAAIQPNTVADASINTVTGKGLVQIYGGQSTGDCAALTPDGDITLENNEVTFAKQNIGFDHDGDGCSDFDELEFPQTNKCGDDPYNPHDGPIDRSEAGTECSNNTDDDGDTFVNDGCPQVTGTAESGAQCTNNTDNDGDGAVNDGCPLADNGPYDIVSIAITADADDQGAETGGQCSNSISDDEDTRVNDGCPTAGLTAENFVTGQCNFSDATNDDPGDDALVNDGCPAVGGTAEPVADCANAIDDDDDTWINDGCATDGAAETGANCANATNDDGDGAINDGCASKGSTIVEGAYFHCKADIQQIALALTGKVFCYIDIPGTPPGATIVGVNNESAGVAETGAQCGASGNIVSDETGANKDYYINDGCPASGAAETPASACRPFEATDSDGDTIVNDGCAAQGAPHGDGLTGTAPPFPFTEVPQFPADHQTLEGTVTGNVFSISFCFEDTENDATLGNVIAVASTNRLTGVGTADIWVAQTDTDCTNLTPQPPSNPPQDEFNDMAIHVVRQKDTRGYDSDQDGCTDYEELLDEPSLGGLRDPYNPYDFFDPTADKAIAGGDFFAVLGRFNQSGNSTILITARPIPSSGYFTTHDRGTAPVPGSNSWNGVQPDGNIAGGDFFAVLGAFNQSCQAAPN